MKKVNLLAIVLMASLIALSCGGKTESASVNNKSTEMRSTETGSTPQATTTDNEVEDEIIDDEIVEETTQSFNYWDSMLDSYEKYVNS